MSELFFYCALKEKNSGSASSQRSMTAATIQYLPTPTLSFEFIESKKGILLSTIFPLLLMHHASCAEVGRITTFQGLPLPNY